jgi:nitroreductase
MDGLSSCTLPDGGRASAMQGLLGRRSVSTKIMGGPGPSGADLDLMVAAAVRAPDHGGMRPGRFVCIGGEARVSLGEVFAGAYARRNPGATDDQLARERGKPMRAPTVVAVAAAIRADHPSVRVVDQQLAAGGAAMNLLNAAHLLGYGAIWLTGESCHDQSVKAAIGLAPEDFVAGWIYVGTALAEPPPRERPQPPEVLRRWQGGPA